MVNWKKKEHDVSVGIVPMTTSHRAITHLFAYQLEKGQLAKPTEDNSTYTAGYLNDSRAQQDIRLFSPKATEFTSSDTFKTEGALNTVLQEIFRQEVRAECLRTEHHWMVETAKTTADIPKIERIAQLRRDTHQLLGLHYGLVAAHHSQTFYQAPPQPVLDEEKLHQLYKRLPVLQTELDTTQNNDRRITLYRSLASTHCAIAQILEVTPLDFSLHLISKHRQAVSEAQQNVKQHYRPPVLASFARTFRRHNDPTHQLTKAFHWYFNPERLLRTLARFYQDNNLCEHSQEFAPLFQTQVLSHLSPYESSKLYKNLMRPNVSNLITRLFWAANTNNEKLRFGIPERMREACGTMARLLQSAITTTESQVRRCHETGELSDPFTQIRQSKPHVNARTKRHNQDAIRTFCTWPESESMQRILRADANQSAETQQVAAG